MPMVLCNATSTLQSLMNSIFEYVVDVFLVVHLHVLLIYTDSYEEHLRHLEFVLCRLQENELYVRRSKCEAMIATTEFLGLYLWIHGIKVGKYRKKLFRNGLDQETSPSLEGLSGYYILSDGLSKLSCIRLLLSQI